jgi:endonuclease/exonuclease/phosphatase family metal-dependent hydrolase
MEIRRVTVDIQVMQTTHLLTAGLLALTLSACGGDDEDPTEPAPPPEMTAVSFNGGLALGFVEATDARSPLTTEAIAAITADTICVQEYWRPGDVTALLDATNEQLPNSWFIDADPGETGEIPCMPGDTDELLTCVAANGCDMVCEDQLASCALAACGAMLVTLPQACLGCIQANIGNSLDEIITACEAPSVSFAYDGSFGIGLLSSYEALAQDELILESTTNRRGVLYTELDTPLGSVHTFCTHLTAVFADLPYPGNLGGWDEEQQAQIDALLAFIEEKAGADGQVMVMGDFNTGPAGTGYVAEVPANYDRLLSGGLANPYTATPGHTCTFCDDNPIVAKDDSPDDDTSAVIDHVLIGGFSGGSGDAVRVLDAAVEVENCGETISSALSDHYGVSLKITGEAAP